MIRPLLRVAVLAACLAAGPALAQVAEPDGYRMENFRAPVPATLQGATVVDAAAVETLIRSGPVVVIDVLPQPPRPDKLPPETLWRPPERRDIPGSAWLANTGFGALSTEMEAYFRDALAALTLGDHARPLVFYCDADCWMSWNAARRAVAEGYTAVHWFPGGVKDWTAAGHPTLPNAPLPVK
ncbi:PQQ-dependent catabolism-associated CXXCW motif protein [Inquilinus sp. YAF38]|uniref:PQQ-dependent catabolism-associated CXXCW motif protein n=1 Tax=Inquilinus sp. YAF38 TaxID=3233084 RepID=UPI003F9038E5